MIFNILRGVYITLIAFDICSYFKFYTKHILDKH